MEGSFFSIDHIGIAVHALEASIARYTTDLGFKLVLREKLPEHGVEAAFLSLGPSVVELLAPLGEGALKRSIEKRGPGLHHICYQVGDIVADLKRLASKGYELIDKTPRKGARNALVAFIHPRSVDGVLTEICQYR
jgi:methylmalonyl-CoA epimerase